MPEARDQTTSARPDNPRSRRSAPVVRERPPGLPVGAPGGGPDGMERRSRELESGPGAGSAPGARRERSGSASGSLGRVPRARPDAPMTGFVFQGQAQRDASKCAPGRSRSGSAAPYRRERPGAARERDWSDRERTRERSLEPGSSGRAASELRCTGRRRVAALDASPPTYATASEARTAPRGARASTLASPFHPCQIAGQLKPAHYDDARHDPLAPRGFGLRLG